jgi:hypothetical protein
MERELIPYEQALEIKELGFNISCYERYYNGELQVDYGEWNGHSIEHIVSAPLYQQAFRFFREKHNLHCFIQCPEEPIGKEIHTYTKWCFSIFEINKQELFFSDEKYETYEEVELECLKKLIELCKKN